MIAADLLTLVHQRHAAASPITLAASRSDMAAMFAVAGFHTGAEIGVWEGGFSEQICRHNANLTLTCVDPWQRLADYKEGKNDPTRMEQAYRTARKRLAPYGCIFLRMTSIEAADQVQDGSLDFAYLDANHLYDHVLADLNVWLPKVRKGGMFAGHDYIARNKDKGFIQVKPAVDQFTREHAIDPWFVLGGDKSASFMWVVQ